MNAQLPQMAVMSDRLGRMVLDWVEKQPLMHPEDGWNLIEQEEMQLRKIAGYHRARMVGREALYFADCLEIKLPFYRGEA